VVRLLIFVSACWLITLVGCRRQSRAEANTLAVGWLPVGAWSGRGDTQTDSFNIESGTWRIKWETRNETAPGKGKFRVEVHSAVSGRPLELAIDHPGVGHDVAYVTEDPRLFDLVIESRDVDWSVTVEEAVFGKVRGDPRREP
jgi:hypothetical protein